MTFSVNTFPVASVIPYVSLRQQIKSGDILICSGSSFFSNLIKDATKSVWSHVAFILHLPEIDRLMVLESVETIGVRTVPLSSYINNYNASFLPYPGRIFIARHQHFEKDKIISLSKRAFDLLGYPYNKQEILTIASRVGLHSLGIKEKAKNGRYKNAYICSEYVSECFQSIGIPIVCDPQGYIIPADYARDPNIDLVAEIPLGNSKNAVA
jgi:hypothetical protein